MNILKLTYILTDDENLYEGLLTENRQSSLLTCINWIQHPFCQGCCHSTGPPPTMGMALLEKEKRQATDISIFRRNYWTGAAAAVVVTRKEKKIISCI